MNQIDIIRDKLKANDILSSGAIDEIMSVIAPYISHGITEEEAREWLEQFFKYGDEEDESSESMIKVGKSLSLIASSREPIAEPESLVKARENHEACFRLTGLMNRYGIACHYICELEARIKQLEGK